MVSEFKPVNGLVLIKPLKLRYKTESQTVVDKEASKGLDPIKDEMVMKVETVKTRLAHQLGEVISIGTLDGDKIGYKEGDTVVYSFSFANDFELQKGHKLINSFNIIAKKVL